MRTLKTAYPAADRTAKTTPLSVGLPVMPSIYAKRAIPVSITITATICAGDCDFAKKKKKR